MIHSKKVYLADKLGILSALLCIIHCLALPVFLAVGVRFLHNPIISSLFVLIAFISIFNVTKGKLSHSNSIFLWAAFTGFVLTVIFEESHLIIEYLMYFFSVCLIVGHLYNMRNINH